MVAISIEGFCMCMLRACVCYVKHFGISLYLVLAAGCDCHDPVAKDWPHLFRSDIDQLHKSKSTERRCKDCFPNLPSNQMQ